MEIINFIINEIKDIINLIIGNDYIIFASNHKDLAKSNIKKLHTYFYLNTIVRTLLITGLTAILFTNPVTLGLLGVGIIYSIKQTYRLIKGIKLDNAFETIINGLEKQAEIQRKQETVDEANKQLKYKIGDKEYTKEEIDNLEPKIQTNTLNNNPTKKLK